MVRKEELEYIKEMYEEPDGYLHYTKFFEHLGIETFGIIPSSDYWDEIQYCVRPTRSESCFYGDRPSLRKNKKGITVCQCVWEMTCKNTHGSLVYYLREVIKAGGVMPVDVKIEDEKVIELDGTHRVLANIQLGNEMIPFHINREKLLWVTCWRPGVILEDGTLDMSYDFSKEGHQGPWREEGH